MEAVTQVVDELLQVEHLEVAGTLVVEGHGVAYTSHGGGVVGAEALFVGGCEERGGAFPVAVGVAAEVIVAAGGEGCRGCGNAAAHETTKDVMLYIVGFHNGDVLFG